MTTNAGMENRTFLFGNGMIAALLALDLHRRGHAIVWITSGSMPTDEPRPVAMAPRWFHRFSLADHVSAIMDMEAASGYGQHFADSLDGFVPWLASLGLDPESISFARMPWHVFDENGVHMHTPHAAAVLDAAALWRLCIEAMHANGVVIDTIASGAMTQRMRRQAHQPCIAVLPTPWHALDVMPHHARPRLVEGRDDHAVVSLAHAPSPIHPWRCMFSWKREMFAGPARDDARYRGSVPASRRPWSIQVRARTCTLALFDASAMIALPGIADAIARWIERALS